MGQKEKRTLLRHVTPFTGSIDGKVPAENVELTHYLAETGRWVAYSKASDGRVFFGDGATEPLARRAAGLRTLAHLEGRASGEVEGLSPEETKNARNELARELAQLHVLVTTSNLPFPNGYPKEVILTELKATHDIVLATDERGLIARWTLPTLLFLAGGFANGIIGKGAEKSLELLAKLLAG
ncbi:hypothetical protein OKW76_03085 [Sphingomonas sp. S1-29]|uniref:hypothetical protein n=1 Tax=Sphingomonas sp. S1-29 TaxID=2991074 RepID=UPI0022402038|nr:hypothetical protein [Sphingomonas sp. S1-29]UZK70053.1 hypothetical protein OKW76_03085 [Sphingomonas sp. S1-29]